MALYLGTTSVVPNGPTNSAGFSPCKSLLNEILEKKFFNHYG
jgi:hypothetical protein